MATLFTVGYEGSKPSDLFASLQDNGVTLLIDVRDAQSPTLPQGNVVKLFRRKD